MLRRDGGGGRSYRAHAHDPRGEGRAGARRTPQDRDPVASSRESRVCGREPEADGHRRASGRRQVDVPLSSWIDSGEAPSRTAWMTIDELDNRADRFWHSVVVALDRAGACSSAGLAEAATALSPKASPGDFPLLLAEVLEDDDEPVVLVLDDFHEIDRPARARGRGPAAAASRRRRSGSSSPRAAIRTCPHRACASRASWPSCAATPCRFTVRRGAALLLARPAAAGRRCRGARRPHRGLGGGAGARRRCPARAPDPRQAIVEFAAEAGRLSIHGDELLGAAGRPAGACSCARRPPTSCAPGWSRRARRRRRLRAAGRARAAALLRRLARRPRRVVPVPPVVPRAAAQPARPADRAASARQVHARAARWLAENDGRSRRCATPSPARQWDLAAEPRRGRLAGRVPGRARRRAASVLGELPAGVREREPAIAIALAASTSSSAGSDRADGYPRAGAGRVGTRPAEPGCPGCWRS